MGRPVATSITAEGAPLSLTSLIWSTGANWLSASRIPSSVTSSGRLPITIRMAALRLLLRLEAAAEGEMQVHALHQPLGLHAQQGGARGAEGEALLLYRAQVADADAIAHVGEFQRACILGHRVLQD